MLSIYQKKKKRKKKEKKTDNDDKNIYANNDDNNDMPGTVHRFLPSIAVAAIVGDCDSASKTTTTTTFYSRFVCTNNF